MNTIPFPDGSKRIPASKPRAQHRLAPFKHDEWRAGPLVAQRDGHGFRVIYGEGMMDYSHLFPRETDFAGGTWIGGTATGITLAKVGDDLLLSFWDVTGGPGEFGIPGIDGE